MTEYASADSNPLPVIILGAGPAGLTAAYELTHHGLRACVCEQDRVVGGLARTVNYKGYRFDIGGHRFFTKVGEVERIWQEILQQNFVERRRLSRIYYRRKFFYYPLRPFNAFLGLGPVETFRVLLSYLKTRFIPSPSEDNFEQWVSNRFGKRLFRIFFETYTEKVWGIPCAEIRAEWAAQRIKNLSLGRAILNIVFKPRGKRKVTTMIDRFHYPIHGPGMMWEKLAQRLRAEGQEVRLESEVIALNHSDSRIVSVVVRSPSGRSEEQRGSHFISSIPIRGLVRRLNPPAPKEIRSAAERLHYRDFLMVGVIVDRPQLFPDNWIYIHSPEVRVARIQNYKNWHPEMCADAAKTNLGLEYFCFKNDALWETPDADLLELARRELDKLGLARCEDFEDGLVVRVPKAYPVYDTDYARYLPAVKAYLGQFSNLQLVGRNGQHRYNNQDHSMYTGLLAVRNILGAHYDLWSVNTEREYHEEK